MIPASLLDEKRLVLFVSQSAVMNDEDTYLTLETRWSEGDLMSGNDIKVMALIEKGVIDLSLEIDLDHAVALTAARNWYSRTCSDRLGWSDLELANFEDQFSISSNRDCVLGTLRNQNLVRGFGVQKEWNVELSDASNRLGINKISRWLSKLQHGLVVVRISNFRAVEALEVALLGS